MIEKAKKYLLEHNVLWINPEEQNDFQSVDYFYTTNFWLVCSLERSKIYAFMNSLGTFQSIFAYTAGDTNYYSIRIDNKLIGLLTCKIGSTKSQLSLYKEPYG